MPAARLDYPTDRLDRPTERRTIGEAPRHARGASPASLPRLPPSGMAPPLTACQGNPRTPAHPLLTPEVTPPMIPAPLPESADTPLPRSVCSECGSPYERDSPGSLCPECTPAERRAYERDGRRRGKTAARGYGARWQRLSARARERQPFCTDCGSPYELTADHSMEAWRRHERGQSIRLRDIDVVCVRCNSERGAARGDRATDTWRQSADDLDAEAARLDAEPWGEGADPPRS